MDINDRFLCFPTSTDLVYCGYIPDPECRKKQRWKRIHIYKPMPGWNNIQKSAPINKAYPIAIRTGEVGGLTVISDSCDMTIHLKTPIMRMHNGKLGVIFQYEPSLTNIYEVMPGISIINDGRFILSNCDKFLYRAEFEVMRMPPEILSQLQQAINSSSTKDIDWYLYELLSILPDKHFNDVELLMDLVHILKNTKGIDDQTRLATMAKLLVERSWAFIPEDIPVMFMVEMTAAQKKYTHLCLIKRMKVMSQDINHKVNQWQSKWSSTKITNQPTTSLTYSYNAMTLLSDIKKKYPKHTIKMILSIDSRFNMIRMDTCKSCHKKHLKGCCKHYNRNNKARTTYIQNAQLI